MQQLEFVNYQPSLSLSIEKGTPQNVQSASVQMRPQRVSTVLNLIESMKKKISILKTRDFLVKNGRQSLHIIIIDVMRIHEKLI